ncbi:hypothetical protein SLEP1_g15662 [Rubroshorea leprosula]|uniref:Transmembrane protein n=1 Tax=Rubroshorea leprosula TaxID=152421 RepID=A0AAV5IYL2_9ROSI|nr:hypothetical protein SLEP1_g15662 [Rubroshorea leprosula]
MENSRNKRGYGHGAEDAENAPESKKQKLPALARYFFYIFVDGCSSLYVFFLSENVSFASGYLKVSVFRSNLAMI